MNGPRLECNVGSVCLIAVVVGALLVALSLRRFLAAREAVAEGREQQLALHLELARLALTCPSCGYFARCKTDLCPECGKLMPPKKPDV